MNKKISDIDFSDINFSKYDTEIKEIQKTYENLKTNKKFMKRFKIFLEKEFIYNFCDNLQISKNKVKIYDRGKPHEIINIPNEYMIIYIFKYNDEYLKIGKTNGKNRNKRPNIYHYNPDSCPSNLAKSILNDKDVYNSDLTKNNIKDWMINNLQRIDILIDNELGVLFLNYLESALHYTYKPKYEGRKDQRKRRDKNE